MSKDFYLNDRSLAAYVEKDWFDHVLRTEGERRPRFEYPYFDPRRLYSDYHERFVSLIPDEKPRRMLEIGSSLGRTLYECALRFPTLERATLVEPSANLAGTFREIFEGDAPLRVLKGNSGFTDVTLDRAPIRAACARVAVDLKTTPFQDLAPPRPDYDLVICSNVIDQCPDTEALIAHLTRSLAPGGVLALSCTYQWQDKYLGNASPRIRNLADHLFPRPLLAEDNIPFHVRVNERHWLTFLSHACVFANSTERFTPTPV